MKLYKKGFETKVNDTIVVIYRLQNGKQLPVRIDEEGIKYIIDEDYPHLVICAQSEYLIKNGVTIRTFISKNHPYYSVSKQL